jgi:hypothetical protein
VSSKNWYWKGRPTAGASARWIKSGAAIPFAEYENIPAATHLAFASYRLKRPRIISNAAPARAEAVITEFGSISGADGGGGPGLAKAVTPTTTSNRNNKAVFFTLILQTLFKLVR